MLYSLQFGSAGEPIAFSTVFCKSLFTVPDLAPRTAPRSGKGDAISKDPNLR